CRPGEAIGATREELDLKARTWTIPASRMKSHREHVVPLSTAALKLLAGIKHREGKIFAIGATTLLETMRAMGGEAVPHGFRSSFRVWVAERTNTPDAIAYLCLAHHVVAA